MAIVVAIGPTGGAPNQVDRNIPADEEIEAAVMGLTNPNWRWVAGMMATFGLRNHECWYATLSRDEVGWKCDVTEGKTGARISRALHPYWVERFELAGGEAPKLNVTGNDMYGERSSRHFKRSGIKFTPYDLRHAFAIRGSLHYKIPVAVMAAWMGHSSSVFLKIYSKHLSAAVKDAAYLEAVRSEDRSH